MLRTSPPKVISQSLYFSPATQTALLFSALLWSASKRAVCKPWPLQLLLPCRGVGRLHLRRGIPYGRQLLKLTGCYRTGFFLAITSVPAPKTHLRLITHDTKFACVYFLYMLVNIKHSLQLFFLKAAAVCLSSGSWGPTHHLTCVDASQLGKGWLESASLSINIIYILLALLTLLTVPLLLLHCCGRRVCSSCPR